MRTRAVVFVVVGLGLLARTSWAQGVESRPGALTSFQSDDELRAYLERANVARLQMGGAPAMPNCKGQLEVTRDTIAVSAGAPGAIPSPRPAMIAGRVQVVGGSAIAGASAVVMPFKLGATSGVDGHFRLRIPADSIVTPESVTVTLRAIGFQAQRARLLVARGDSLSLNIALCQSPLQLGELVVANAGSAKESVTNTQHAGVDEGDIVKVHGDHLVILRRGRLFTVRIGAGSLKRIAAVNAFGPDVDPKWAWYDEMLIAGDKIVVIGYSYARGGTELGVFRINERGHLRYVATYQLRSDDYYSSRNYASRLIGSKLIFYAPLDLRWHQGDPLAALPALRRWRPGTEDGGFERIVTPQRVYVPARRLRPSDAEALHTVTVCDLASDDLRCEATAVIGGIGRVFYVSSNSVYVWTTHQSHRGRTAVTPPMLFRMPLDGSRPSALIVAGSPVDQFSFLEDEGQHLNVLVRSEARGDGMWRAEGAAGDVALLRMPLSTFDDSAATAPPSAYRPLPAPAGSTFQNRFVGDYLLYGTGNGWFTPSDTASAVYVAPIRGGPLSVFALPHGIDRIEAMGSDAVVVGTDTRDLYFSGVRLDTAPTLAERFVVKQATQGELRSHGFFYRPESESEGMLGLPTRAAGRPGYEHLAEGSASIVFVRRAQHQFSELGQLAANSAAAANDGCVASCVDWYGNARPLFIRERIFALLGYELVEGRIRNGRLTELRRVNFTPAGSRTAGR